jgi:hypothetical protein
MSEKLEQVAAGLADEFRRIISEYAGVPFEQTKVEMPNAGVWLRYARRAVADMREPSMPMIHAAIALMHGQPECQCMHPGSVVEYNTMIDEALR